MTMPIRDYSSMDTPERYHLPGTRKSITHRFKVGETKGYVTVGLFEDGTAGEVYLRVSKQGSAPHGMLDSFAILLSMALQHGIPLESLCRKFKHISFEPSGPTENPAIPFADSVIDYVFRWLELAFVKKSGEALKKPPSV